MPQCNFFLNPIFLVPLLTLVGAVVCIVCAVRVAKWSKRVAFLVVALVLLVPPAFVTVAVFPELVDARFRTYKRFYRDIEVGMTRAEVDQLIARHYPPNGKRGEPFVCEDFENRLSFLMDPEGDRHPNCEGIQLTMKDGKVVEKSYTPD